jgi:uncharacterized membrane protein YfcA
MDLPETIILLIASLVTAAISGVLGMAGGVTLISLMAVILPASQVVPLHGIIQLASTGTRTLAMARYIRWRFVLVFAPTMALGVWLATFVWSGEKMEWFRPAIGALILLFLFLRHRAPRLRNLPLWVYPPAGILIGFVNIFVGASGPLAAPLFYRDEFTKEEVIGTQAACLAWGHLLKIPASLAGVRFHRLLAIIGRIAGLRGLRRADRQAYPAPHFAEDLYGLLRGAAGNYCAISDRFVDIHRQIKRLQKK